MRFNFFFLAVTALALSACTIATESNPARTATEQMLISTAADRAADRLALKIPPQTPVFIDAGNFEGTDSKYAIGAIRTSLLKQGAHVVDDKKKARVVIEIRAGALSTDKKKFLVGIPSFNVPVPFASSPLAFPELALYESDKQQGVAKFAFTGYDAKSGALVQADDPQYGFAEKTKRTVMVFVSWTENDSEPEGSKDQAMQVIDRQMPASLSSNRTTTNKSAPVGHADLR